ncbi:MAG: PASTA domain-containing protein [Nitrospirae bacterium]|nr:PASTA domain-containing protein [Nitrospirota bacterium]
MRTFYRLTLLFTVFIAIVFVAAIIAFNIFTSTSSIPVPDLSGKSLMDATMALSDKRLYLKIGGEDYSTDVPSGFIMKQDIPQGNKIKEGRTLSVILSKGPYIQYMPDFTGVNIKEAQAIAAKNNIKSYRIVTVHSDKIEKDKVIAQIPAPEEKGNKDLSLLVSDGAYDTTYYCPDFAGRPIAEAQELAKSLGIELVLNGTGNKISDQQPQTHSIIKKFSKVTITLKDDEKKEEKIELKDPKDSKESKEINH